MAKDESGKITFLASFPAIQSAITISGDGNGMRLKLDVPETEFVEAIYMLQMRRKPFRVTIESLTELDDETTKGAERESIGVGRRRTTNRRDQR